MIPEPALEAVILECAVNVSEGRDQRVIGAIAAAGGDLVLDVHSDGHHHRSVLTLAGPPAALEEAVRAVAEVSVVQLDLRDHRGEHPRLGVVDVVPFCPLRPANGAGPVELADDEVMLAVPSRDRFSTWCASTLGVPCFRYGPSAGGEPRTLPDVRRSAFVTLHPDPGPPRPHSTAGAAAVGARQSLIAYNVLVAPPGDVALAREVAAAIRGPGVRALGLDLGGTAQVSCNLIDPFRVGPAVVYDEVASRLEAAGAGVARAELVGLLPAGVLRTVPPHRLAELDLDESRTVEARLAEAGVGLSAPRVL